VSAIYYARSTASSLNASARAAIPDPRVHRDEAGAGVLLGAPAKQLLERSRHGSPVDREQISEFVYDDTML
jgi:hypothetical protein